MDDFLYIYICLNFIGYPPPSLVDYVTLSVEWILNSLHKIHNVSYSQKQLNNLYEWVCDCEDTEVNAENIQAKLNRMQWGKSAWFLC